MSKPTFSIIIPAYNADATIDRCIDSVMSQTYDDFEIIVINDGSTDDTGKRLKKRKAKDYLVLIDQANAGVAKARNAGIDIAKGEYLVFIDSDDEISEDYLAEFKNMIDSNSRASILMSSIVLQTNKKSTELRKKLSNNGDQQQYLDDMPDFMASKQILSPCGKAYLSNAVRDLKVRFRSGLTVGEDLMFNLDVLSKNPSYESTKGGEYIYNTSTEGSLSKAVDRSVFDNYDKLYTHTKAYVAETKGDGRKADLVFSRYYIDSLYHGLSIDGSRSAYDYALSLSSTYEASRSLASGGLVGFIYAVPILSNRVWLLRLAVSLRKLIKDIVR